MKFSLLPAFLLATAFATVAAQELKPVPKDSVRVLVPGCTKDYILTAGRPAEDQPGGSAVPEGTHLRMNGPKKIMAEIKGHEGSRIEITGLIKRGQVGQEGIPLGGRVRITGGSRGPSSALGGGMASPASNQLLIDVEGWRYLPGDCPR